MCSSEHLIVNYVTVMISNEAKVQQSIRSLVIGMAKVMLVQHTEAAADKGKRKGVIVIPGRRCDR